MHLSKNALIVRLKRGGGGGGGFYQKKLVWVVDKNFFPNINLTNSANKNYIFLTKRKRIYMESFSQNKNLIKNWVF